MKEEILKEDLPQFAPAKEEQRILLLDHIETMKHSIGFMRNEAATQTTPAASSSSSLGVNIGVTADLAKMIEVTNNDPMRVALINMAKDVLYTVGGDMYSWYKTSFYPWLKGLILGSNVDTYNNIGYMQMNRNDRLWVKLDHADDQVNVTVNSELVNQLALNQPGAWNLADAFPAGKQLLVMTIVNSGGGEYAGNITLVRDSQKNDPGKYWTYVANPTKQWSEGGTKHMYWMKFETH